MATTSLLVANLTTTAPYVASFVVEVYSDSGLTTLVGSDSCPAVSGGSGFVQANALVVHGLTYGVTYYARAGVVAPVTGITTWSGTDTIVMGVHTAPTGVTYSSTTLTATVSGISVTTTPGSVPTNLLNYEAIWVTDGSTPATTDAPIWTGNANGSGNLVFFAGGSSAAVVHIYIRSVNTAGQRQTWTSLGSATVLSSVTGSATQQGVQQEAYTYAADTGTANAYVITLSPAPTIVAGSEISFKAAHANTGASTVTVNGTSYPITKNGTTALAGAEISANQIVTCKCDGTNFQLAGGTGGSTTFGGDLATVTGTTQKVTGLNQVPFDTSVTLIDGMTWQYNASSGKWLPVFDRATRPVSAVAGKPAAAQLVLIYTAEATETFPANFTAPQSYGSLGANPTSTAIYSVYKNTTNVGTVSISTSGVFTFATTSGAAFTLNAGDRLTMVAPGSQDATLSDVSITLVGTRGSVSASISAPPPVITWRGTYSGGTAYNLYDEVYYSGSSYICIAASTGNLPTNTSFWNLVAQAGSNGSNGTNGTNGTNGQMLYVDAQNQTQTYCVDSSGTPNAITIAPATAATSYVAGQLWSVKVANSVTGATTINVSSLGNKNVKKWSGGSLVNLATGDITANQLVDFEYDGTQFIAKLGVGGAAPGLVLLESHTASSSAELDFTASISSLYDVYVIELIGIIPATNAALFGMQFSTNGGSTYDTSATYDNIFMNNGSNGLSSNDTQINLSCGDGITSSAVPGLAGSVQIYDPLNTSNKKLVMGEAVFNYSGNGNYFLYTMSGVYKSTTAVNAFRVKMSTGNIASGTVRCYGRTH